MYFKRQSCLIPFCQLYPRGKTFGVFGRIKYIYEPFIKIDKKGFFPDFLIKNKIIIEATEWNGVEKAYKLKEKIDILSKKYKVFVIIPKHLYSKYKILDDNLIIGIENLDLVAQW